MAMLLYLYMYSQLQKGEDKNFWCFVQVATKNQLLRIYTPQIISYKFMIKATSFGS